MVLPWVLPGLQNKALSGWEKIVLPTHLGVQSFSDINGGKRTQDRTFNRHLWINKNDGCCDKELEPVIHQDSREMQRHHFADKWPYSQSYGLSSSHVWMWELNNKEGWALMNWCFWTAVLEKILESALGSKEIKPVHPKGNRSWIFIRRTDAEAEAPKLWPPDVKNQFIEKYPYTQKRLKAKGKEGGRVWDVYMASPTQWIWIWANSGR